MPLFDPATAKSTEGRVWAALVDRISETESYQELVGVSTAAEARETIHLGSGPPPFDGEEFTADELALRHCWTCLFVGEDSSARDYLGLGNEETYQNGRISLEVHWKPTAADLNAPDGRNDCFMFCLDRTSAMRFEAREAVKQSADHCPRNLEIERIGLGWSKDAEEAGNDPEMLYQATASWGDLEE